MVLVYTTLSRGLAGGVFRWWLEPFPLIVSSTGHLAWLRGWRSIALLNGHTRPSWKGWKRRWARPSCFKRKTFRNSREVKRSARDGEAALATLGGDKRPIIPCIWMWTKIEFEKLDYNYYPLSNYVFDADYLRKLMNFLKGLIWVYK